MIAVFFVMLFSVGCSAEKGVEFTDLVQDEVASIRMRHPGSGVLYATTDADLINQFVSAMKSEDYYKGSPQGVVGPTNIDLYNADDKKIADIVFEGKGAVRINDESYRLKSDVNETELQPFFKELMTEQNIVQE